MTRYRYRKGRMVASEPEPEWDDEQLAIMVALAEYRASLCPCGCGHLLTDTTASEEDVSFTVPVPNACLARMKLTEAQRKWADHPYREALLWHAVKR